MIEPITPEEIELQREIDRLGSELDACVAALNESDDPEMHTTGKIAGVIPGCIRKLIASLANARSMIKARDEELASVRKRHQRLCDSFAGNDKPTPEELTGDKRTHTLTDDQVEGLYEKGSAGEADPWVLLLTARRLLREKREVTEGPMPRCFICDDLTNVGMRDPLGRPICSLACFKSYLETK